MVGVAKWLTHRIVIPAYVGSKPITHPIRFSVQNEKLEIKQRELVDSPITLPCLNQESLYQKYVIENLLTDEVAYELGCALLIICMSLKKYGVAMYEAVQNIPPKCHSISEKGSHGIVA